MLRPRRTKLQKLRDDAHALALLELEREAAHGEALEEHARRSAGAAPSADALSWAELRTLALRHGVKVKGKRPELVEALRAASLVS